jgi:citrate lyase beta subunit
MSKHTPGPWAAICPKERHFYEGRDITSFCVMSEKTRGQLREEGHIHYREDREKVDNISLCGYVWWADMTDSEAIANAHLIAAAPELLEALKAFVADWCDETGMSSPSHESVRFAQAAIAKAEGAQ